LILSTVALTAAGLGGAVSAAYLGMYGAEAAAGVRVWGLSVGGQRKAQIRRRLQKKAAAFLARPIVLKGAKQQIKTTWKEVGATIAVAAMVERALAVGHRSDPWQNLLERARARAGMYRFKPVIGLNRKKAIAYLRKLKETLDRRPERGRLDLRKRKIKAGKTGYALKLHRSLVRLLRGARAGRQTVALAVETRHPALSKKRVSRLDISTVMGWYETRFKSSGRYRHRAHNLRVAARKLNGWVIMPGEVFSINEALGPRTRQEGYRVAPVLAGGEKVDGMAGGTCQISSTLHAAAYFAGLDILESDVHSQPSHYIELGLDATVVWPDTDLKLRNQYDFPVVVHFEVAFGRVRTEILGKKRLYKIGFERRIVRQRPYKEVIRKDPEMLLGKRKIEQRGEFGYTVRRRRVFFDKAGNEIKAQYWTLVYPPTTLIIRMGTKEWPDPSLMPEPQEFPPVPPKPTPQKFVRITQ
jgi:vancomycin resistance protein YoaR